MIADSAFEASIRPHLPSVLETARRVVRCEDLAHDVVQETLIALWRLPKRPRHIGPWLRKAAIHRALHLLRGRRRCKRHETRACRECDERLESSAYRLVEIDELRADVRRELERLPAEQRDVVRLHSLEGADYETVARRLELPIGTVRSRLHRARGTLRQRLARIELARRPSRVG